MPPLATAVTDEADASSARRSRRSWQMLGLIGAVLLVAFAGIAWAQWRMLDVLEQSVADRTHSLTFAFGQLENEYLRLNTALQREALAPGTEPGEALSLRHELFVSRIHQVGEGSADLMARIGHADDPVRAALHRYIEQVDPVLGEAVGTPPGPAAVRRVLLQLAPLADPLHQLSIDAYHHDAETAGRRDEAVATQHRMAVALTVFQCVLTLLFAAVVVRQLRSAERHRRRLEALAVQLRQARHEAEAASRAKSAFLENMSHELRTPFHGLLGMLSLIEDGTLGAEQQRRLETARRSGDHLMSILNDVLDLARLASGDIGIEPAETAVRRLFEDVLALMQPQAQQGGLALCLDVAADVPEHLQIDAKRVRQILFNLLSNAIKFTAQGEVRIEVGWRLADSADTADAADSSPATLQVRVVDTGIGMDEATLARLFQRYAQGDASIQRRFGGTGLGLEISRTLARRMGGDLTATSVPGHGSTFSLTLRVSPSGAAAAGPAPVPAPAPRDLPATVVPHAPARPALPADARRALVCDDNLVNRLLMQAYLERCGCAAVLCDDGALAVALARCNAFDLIVMDVHMPGLDGLTASRQIRAHPGDGRRPLIVAVTADPLDDTRAAAAQAGIDELLAKPLSLADVAACLQRHLGGPTAGA